jgi:hypothetical protein
LRLVAVYHAVSGQNHETDGNDTESERRDPHIFLPCALRIVFMPEISLNIPRTFYMRKIPFCAPRTPYTIEMPSERPYTQNEFFKAQIRSQDDCPETQKQTPEDNPGNIRDANTLHFTFYYHTALNHLTVLFFCLIIYYNIINAEYL